MKIRKAIFVALGASVKNNRPKIHFWFASLLLALALVSSVAVKLQITSAQESQTERDVKPDFVPAATFTVNSIADDSDGSCDAAPGDCTLREAIIAANGNVGLDTIDFTITGTIAVGATAGPTLGTPLPDITSPIIIEGGGTPNGSCTGTATLVIELNGTSAGVSSNGLTLAAGSTGSTLRGLAINRFNGNGIEILSASNIITGNYIGTNLAGTAAAGNASNGISITSGNANTVGGATVGLRNVISGNAGRGVVVNGFGGTSGNSIQGNFIGTNAAGTAAVGNGGDGIDISQSANNTIGGDATTALGCAPGNLISGNGEDGVNIFGASSTGNTVQGNLIGTNAAGTADLGNVSQGIYLNSNSNAIGGATATTRNVISGNDGGGVNLGGGNSNVVRGNYIGTNSAGTAALRNPDGIRIDNAATGNTVGGGAAGEGNLISGNDVGVHIADGSGNFVRGNRIGTQADGTSDLGNLEAGVYVHEPTSTSNVIGGTGAGEGNTIHFNGDGTLIPTLAGEGGIVVYFGATSNQILGNSIADNTGLGIDLGLNGANGVTPNDANDADSGDANNLQNYPVLVTASNSAATTTITGTLNSTVSRMFRVEFFSDTAADASGNGEGRTFIGAQTYTTDASGNAVISFTPATQVTAGNFVSATATDSVTGDSSEFSMSRVVTGPTAATAPISGRLRTAGGIGISGAFISLLDTQTGETFSVATSPNGTYIFDGLPVGRSYIVTPTAFGYSFNPANKFISLTEELTTVDFVGVRNRKLRNF